MKRAQLQWNVHNFHETCTTLMKRCMSIIIVIIKQCVKLLTRLYRYTYIYIYMYINIHTLSADALATSSGTQSQAPFTNSVPDPMNSSMNFTTLNTMCVDWSKGPWKELWLRWPLCFEASYFFSARDSIDFILQKFRTHYVGRYQKSSLSHAIYRDMLAKVPRR